jgi:hypothetical protein
MYVYSSNPVPIQSKTSIRHFCQQIDNLRTTNVNCGQQQIRNSKLRNSPVRNGSFSGFILLHYFYLNKLIKFVSWYVQEVFFRKYSMYVQCMCLSVSMCLSFYVPF